MATTNVLLAMLQDTGTPTLRPALLALQASTLTSQPSPAFAQLLPPSSTPTTDVLLVTPPTTGTQLKKPASHAPKTAIGIHPPLSVSAALKASALMPLNLNAPAPAISLTTMLLPRNALPATAHQSGTASTLNV